MNSRRAKEILESHGVISVSYHDSPIWIEQLKADDQVEITVLETNERMDVPVNDLLEG